jgi:DNA-directed RNA polymerase subunit alpha
MTPLSINQHGNNARAALAGCLNKEGFNLVKIIEPKIETAELRPDGTYGRFVGEPLDRGFGTTLGNSLRRVLLSSLPGVAVISVKIDGIQHEFSTIPGVKEDVTEIILNIKGLTAKLYSDEPKTVRIEAEGECEVTAGSIEVDSDVEILDPSMHIATLGAGAKLSMEITLKKGQGYVPAERNKQIELERPPSAPSRWTASTPRCTR